MNKIEDKLVELILLKEEIIDEMRVINNSVEQKIHLLCKLEVVRYDIANVRMEYKGLLEDKMMSEKAEDKI